MVQIDVEAVSGIFGAISIASWVVVFSPQIYHNFHNKSADGLSLPFIIIWLVGDIFNIIGSIMQDVLTSMLILAIYYTVADLVLLCQMFWYRGWFSRKHRAAAALTEKPHPGRNDSIAAQTLVGSPIIDGNISDDEQSGSDRSVMRKELAARTPKQTLSPLVRTFIRNILIVVGVSCAGIFGWLIKDKVSGGKGENTALEDDLTFDTTGQVFGYLGAATYVASRIPQLWMNWRRKATDGLSMLFFTFAFLGNSSYILSIVAYDPNCAGITCEPGESSRIYKKYILINLSWILGSAINMIEDCAIFAQYFMYRQQNPSLSGAN